MIHIGTSGWLYSHWQENFYPTTVPRTKWFNYYQKYFDTVELNTTFYHLPKETTITKWRDETKEDFTFVLKASRFITHIKKLSDPEESIDIFFERIAPLQEKTPVILFQLPPSLQINTEKLDTLLTKLPSGYRYTLEFRHESWFQEETYEILRAHNASLCIYELAGFVSPVLATGDHVYVRLHGPTTQKYRGSYSEESLISWADHFKKWQKEKRDVFCYFDNDERAYAVKNALRLKELVGNKIIPLPQDL
jgi:uncharacterized protein YecE (DUF72 family)